MIMKTGKIILCIIALIFVGFLLFTLMSPILIIAEDTSEGTPGIDMAAKFTILSGFNWIYPGSSHNAQGQTLHNIHLNSPDDPYGAARDIISYSYNFTPHLIISVNDYAAEDIFGEGLVDNIRANDWGSGMDRGPAVDSAMSQGTFNPFAIFSNIITGNIKFYFV